MWFRSLAASTAAVLVLGIGAVAPTPMTPGELMEAARAQVLEKVYAAAGLNADVSPEAAAGGVIALVEDGDIDIDIPSRSQTLQVSEAKLDERRAPGRRDRIPARRPRASGVSRPSGLRGDGDLYRPWCGAGRGEG